MPPHLISRATILGTGLIGGSFALALRKYATDLRISGWDRPEIVQQARERGAIDQSFSTDLGPALRDADLIYIALPIGVTLDLLPEIARFAPPHALVTDACSTKLRITQTAAGFFPDNHGALFLGGHPMAGRELAGIAHADPDLFRNAPYALIHPAFTVAGVVAGVAAGLPPRSPASLPPKVVHDYDTRASAFLNVLLKNLAPPLLLRPAQHYH